MLLMLLNRIGNTSAISIGDITTKNSAEEVPEDLY